jgi:hypothetical protein
MTIQEAMVARHSVRQYKDMSIEAEKISALQAEIDACNQAGSLHIQLVTDEPEAFSGRMAHYGSFRGVTNYIALVGRADSTLEERCGYYGERLVLFCQQLGLNTCWVALTYSKRKAAFRVEPGEKLCLVIALGYGVNQGVPHKSKPVEKLTQVSGETPDWFRRGMEAVLLAPTAVNQQKFTFSLEGNRVIAKAGLGFYTKIDLGIAKYHFEVGAGEENFTWE